MPHFKVWFSCASIGWVGKLGLLCPWKASCSLRSPWAPCLSTQLSALPTQVQPIVIIYYVYYYKSMDLKTPSTQRQPAGLGCVHSACWGAAGEVQPFSKEGTMSVLAPFPARRNTIPISLAINSNHTAAGKSFNSYSQHKKQRKLGRPLSWEGPASGILIKWVCKVRLSG